MHLFNIFFLPPLSPPSTSLIPLLNGTLYAIRSQAIYNTNWSYAVTDLILISQLSQWGLRTWAFLLIMFLSTNKSSNQVLFRLINQTVKPDFLIIDKQSITVYDFSLRMFTLVSVDEILLPSYVNLSNNFRDLPFNVEMARFYFKQMNSVLFEANTAGCLGKTRLREALYHLRSLNLW